jgi:7-cyano-7-deazaguanine reductase
MKNNIKKNKTTLLGTTSPLPQSPEDAILEKVPNPHADTHYNARFTAPEFTSICPVTGQPDFAHLVIDIVPNKWLIESKSLKLYLGSFRNHGAFHEDCTVRIGKDIAAFIKPHYLRIGIHVVAFRLMCSGKPENFPKMYGCLTKA